MQAKLGHDLSIWCAECDRFVREKLNPYFVRYKDRVDTPLEVPETDVEVRELQRSVPITDRVRKLKDIQDKL